MKSSEVPRVLASVRELMQAWADYLDALRDGAADKVVPIKRNAS